MSEYAGKRSRGRMVGPVFAMQGAGLILGPLAAAVLLGSGISHGVAWRILLGLGAVPALSVFWLRRKINETPRFALAADEAWFLLDFAYYGNTISSPEILRLLSPHASLLRTTLLQLAIFAVFALPGYVLAIALLDKTRRRSIQLAGLALTAFLLPEPRGKSLEELSAQADNLPDLLAPARAQAGQG